MPFSLIPLLMVVFFMVFLLFMIVTDSKNEKMFFSVNGVLVILVGIWFSFYCSIPWRIARTETVPVQTTKDGTEQFVIVETERKIHKIYTLEKFGHIIPKGVAVKVSYHDMGSYCGIRPDGGQSFSLSLSKEGGSAREY